MLDKLTKQLNAAIRTHAKSRTDDTAYLKWLHAINDSEERGEPFVTEYISRDSQHYGSFLPVELFELWRNGEQSDVVTSYISELSAELTECNDNVWAWPLRTRIDRYLNELCSGSDAEWWMEQERKCSARWRKENG